jgi:Domain of unknown function (DUF6487)
MNPTCPKCAKSMEPGFVIDKTYGEDYSSPPEWAEGAPEPSFWTGVKLKDKQRHPVSTFRCPSCGYLESYAR